MNKLLFVAGEPGCGKSECVAKPLSARDLGLVLHTDFISQRAAKHYQRTNSLGCKWQLWKLEFDRADNRVELEEAIRKSMNERKGPPVNRARNLICEGVLSGHPMFRQIMQSLLPQFGFTPNKVCTVAICLSRDHLGRNLKMRGRSEDQDTEFVMARSRDYQERLKIQKDVKCVVTAEACLETAAEFLRSPH